MNVCGDVISSQCVVVPESDGRGAEEKVAGRWSLKEKWSVGSFDLSIVCSFKHIERLKILYCRSKNYQNTVLCT